MATNSSEYMKAWREKNAGKFTEYNRRWRSKNRIRFNESEKLRKSRPETSIKVKARDALNKAVRAGKVVRPSRCSSCKRRSLVEAHHHNGYSDPLDVQWLCRKCHNKQHPPTTK